METKKLKLNKETIASLDHPQMVEVKGGGDAWGECWATYRCDGHTGGCSDGCLWSFACSALNCTDGHCTADCPTGMEKKYTSGV